MAPALHDWDRQWAALRQRHGALRDRLPDLAVRALKAGRDGFKTARTWAARVEHRSPHENLLHCCVHKTGSQWIAALLDDLVTYRYCGLRRFQYQTRLPGGFDPRGLRERRFDRALPAGRILGPLYVDHEGYRTLPHTGSRRAFFVQRDPRDVLVSWYYSTRYSHVPLGDLPRLRARLEALDVEGGLRFAVDHLEAFGAFEALRSWARAAPDDASALVVRYEDLVGPEAFSAFRAVYDHLDVPIPDDALRALVDAYAFRRLTRRAPGEADARSHLRAGQPGNWREHLPEAVADRLRETTRDLAAELGYAD
ncbi:MAG TPA: sulfotransferase domain-containing protein [Myxococcota bacterium]|nr:sulfotransferase domain-containing protein [Myxococcota bacterium]